MLVKGVLGGEWERSFHLKVAQLMDERFATVWDCCSHSMFATVMDIFRFEHK